MSSITKPRSFIPKPGQKVVLTDVDFYNTLPIQACGISEWEELIVIRLEAKLCTYVVLRSWHKEPKPENEFSVPMPWVHPPRGWQSKYTIDIDDASKQHGVPNYVAYLKANMHRGVEVYKTEQLDGNYRYHIRFLPTSYAMPCNYSYANEYVETLDAEECEECLEFVTYDCVEHTIPETRNRRKRKEVLDELRSTYLTVKVCRVLNKAYCTKKVIAWP